MNRSLEAGRWDEEYRRGKRYNGDPPVPFVGTILEELGEEGKRQFGLYVGCGNGRNYIPLLDAGLNLYGLDISSEGIKQIKDRRPEAKVLVRDLTQINSARVWDYIVALQVFQHGDVATVQKLFGITSQALKDGGKLFLRVNSASTEIYHDHERIEEGEGGELTVIYKDGPKKGQKIHFYSREELERLTSHFSFRALTPLREVVEIRKPPKTGTWSQFEAIWQKA